MKYVSYYRMLTGDREEFSHDLCDQRKIVYDFLQPEDELLNEFIEICPYSDGDGDRPILAGALVIAKLKGAIFIVASLNRLSRFTYLISVLMKSKIKIVFCDLPNTSAFTVRMHAGIAQYGVQNAHKGFSAAMGHLGAGITEGFGLRILENVALTEVNHPKHVHLTKNQTDEFAMEIMHIIKNILRHNFSRMGIANSLNTCGIKTSCDNQWTPKTVKNLLLHYYSIIPSQESIPHREGYTMSHFLPSILPGFFSLPPPLLYNTRDTSSILLPQFDSTSVNYVSYYRISTRHQEQTGYGLDDQRKKVRDFLKPNDNLLDEFTEVESGCNDDRPILDEALKIARLKNATLIVSKLDRLARSTSLINKLQKTNVKFVICELPHATPLTIHMLSSVAEYEADLIRQRIRDALAQAKLRGVKLGSPENLRTTQADRMKGVQTMKRKADMFAMEMIPSIMDIKSEGIKSYSGIAKELDRLKFATARGGKWTGTTVKNVMKRYDLLMNSSKPPSEWLVQPINKQTRTMLIKAGMSRTKSKGVVLGISQHLINTSADHTKGVQTMKCNADEFAMEIIPSILKIKSEGIESYSGIARELNRLKLSTARFKKWTGTTVKNVMKRYDLLMNSSKPPSEWLVQPINKQTLIKAGMARAKSKGVVLGNSQNLINTPANRQKATRAIKAKADDFVIYMIPIINNVRQAGQHSYAGIARELNLRGLKSSRGREWTRKAVRNLLKRYDNIISSSSNPNLIISSNTTQSKILPSNHILLPPPIPDTVSHPNVSQILPEANISLPPSLVLDYISSDNTSSILPTPFLISEPFSSLNTSSILPDFNISPSPPIISTNITSPILPNRSLPPILPDSTLPPILTDFTLPPIFHDSILSPILPDSILPPILPDSTLPPPILDPIT